jgi:UDP-N-acetylmuramate--alanine ligase
MSALARWFNANGKNVVGYDKTPSPLTKKLSEEGISIHYEDDLELIPPIFKKPNSNILVVYTPAIPKNNQELTFFRENGFKILKRAAVLGIIAKAMFSLAIAGTHGKTTTSSMVAHILRFSGLDMAAFLGGISSNYESNLLINKDLSTETPVVLEADEFDRSFLHLYPNIAIVTSTDADHLDIYGNKNELIDTFKEFIGQIKPKGALIISAKTDKEVREKLAKDASICVYALKKEEIENWENVNSISYIQNLKIENAAFVFDFYQEKKENNVKNTISIKDIILNVAGFHNTENALAAISLALELGIEKESIKDAITTYKGVKRRFEYLIKEKETVYIDDYAHHPTEINACLTSIKSLYPNRKITAVFQPHLYTRTRDFAEGFSEALSLADELVLLDIYPARELPIKGINSQMLLDKVSIENKQLVEKSELLNFIEKADIEVLVTMGAGDIDRFVKPIRDLLNQKNAL